MKDYVEFGGYKVEYETVREATKPKEKPIKGLICCCCGECTLGRQWRNRDIGFGLCERCADMIEKKEDAETMVSCYGKRGVHYAIIE